MTGINYRETECAICGSTEHIQHHHIVPKNDDTIVCICAKCHSECHPDVPKGLFFHKFQGRHWDNISASAIARMFGVHPSTVIRNAKKLNLLGGVLSNESMQLIKDNMSRKDCVNDKGIKRVGVLMDEKLWANVRAQALLANKPLSRWIEEAFLSKLNGNNNEKS
jgi:hypothetical protein